MKTLTLLLLTVAPQFWHIQKSPFLKEGRLDILLGPQRYVGTYFCCGGCLQHLEQIRPIRDRTGSSLETLTLLLFTVETQVWLIQKSPFLKEGRAHIPLGLQDYAGTSAAHLL